MEINMEINMEIIGFGRTGQLSVGKESDIHSQAFKTISGSHEVSKSVLPKNILRDKS